MKTLSFLCLFLFIISQVKAQDNDFENNYDTHIAYADSIYQVGNDLIQEELFEEGLKQVKEALNIYDQYTYVDHKVDKAVCYVTLAFCYLRLEDEENTKLWLSKVGKSLGKERVWLESVAGLYAELGDQKLHEKYSKKSQRCN
jgi:hypothetical protein